MPARRLWGKTLGVIGFGHIGRAVAERLRGFGISAIVYHPRQDAETIARYGGKKVTFDELLRQADMISLHVL